MKERIAISFGAPAGDVLGPEHFGANFLFNRVARGDGIGADGLFDEAAAALGVRHLRYPGGTIAERQFSLAAPDNAHQPVSLIDGTPIDNASQHALTPLSDFLAEAARLGAQVTVVLPTVQYAEAIESGQGRAAAEAEVTGFVRALMTGPHASLIEAFEIGNEWARWFDSAAAYGRTANAIAEWVGIALAEMPAGTMPKLAVQTSARAARLEETAAIVAELSPSALAAVDAVIVHNYRPEPWTDAPTTAGKFSHSALVEQAAGRDLDILVTEYNLANGAPALGLVQGAGLIAMLHQHARLGADAAHVWPVLETVATPLAEPDGVDIALRAGGAALRLAAQALPGSRAVVAEGSRDIDGDGDADLLVHGFRAEDGARQVLFVSSLVGTPLDLTLDLSGALRPGATHLWRARLTAPEATDPTEPTLVPVLHQWAEGDRLTDPRWAAEMPFALAPYEVHRLELADATAPGVLIQGQIDIVVRASAAPEIVVLDPDADRLVLHDFDPALDRFDVSALGAGSLADLTLTPLIRRDGTIAWIEIAAANGAAAAVVRYDDRTAMSADALTGDVFVFAADDPPDEDFVRRTDSFAEDMLRGTARPEIFALQGDEQRDLIRGFEPGIDQIDLGAWNLAEFDDLTIRDLVRRDGTVAWIEITAPGPGGDLLVRMAPAEASAAAALGPDDFLF